MSRLSIIDASFLLVETEDSPKHVGALQVFQRPAGAGEDYEALVCDKLRQSSPLPPFNHKLRKHLISLPEWVEEAEPDWGYHLHRMALPAPGSDVQLSELVASLHATTLDRDRPLWQLFVIEGLEHGRFALYTKIHHAYGDGVTIGGWLTRWLSASARSRKIEPFWAHPSLQKKPRRPGSKERSESEFMASPLAGLPDLAGMVAKQALKAVGKGRGGTPLPFLAPRTAFNKQVTRARSLAITSLPVERMKSVGKAADATLNDVLLTICDLAMQRYLGAHGGRSDRPLVAQMPISLRQPGQEAAGNQVTIALVEMGKPKTRTPRQRLRQVSRACSEVKEEYVGLSVEAATLYITLLEFAEQLGESLHLTNQIPPLGNVVISNLPGPRSRLYLGGAALCATYPVSTFAPGVLLNITVYSYGGELYCGLLAGRDAIPELQALAVYMGEALEELEQSVAGEEKATA